MQSVRHPTSDLTGVHHEPSSCHPDPGERTRAKWVVVGFWVVILVLAFPLSSKLTGAEKNDARLAAGNAESTKVVNLQSQFQSPNVYPRSWSTSAPRA